MSNIILPADCTLRSARPIQVQIAAALQEPEAVTMDCSAVTHADFAGVQLLVCATRSATTAGRPLRLTGVPDVLAAVLTRAGFALGPASDHIVINEG